MARLTLAYQPSAFRVQISAWKSGYQMLEQPIFAWTGTDLDLRGLIAAHPWVTMVSSTSSGLVISHLPVLPEDQGVDVVSHLPIEDARQHELGTCDVVLIVQGPHGYISADWYVGGPYVSTWNFVVAHLHGKPTVLDEQGTYEVLQRTMDHFEHVRPHPFRLNQVSDYAHQIAPHVVGFHLTPTKTVAKAKLSQDKPEEDVAAVLEGLECPGDVHENHQLAQAMRAGGIP